MHWMSFTGTQLILLHETTCSRTEWNPATNQERDAPGRPFAPHSRNRFACAPKKAFDIKAGDDYKAIQDKIDYPYVFLPSGTGKLLLAYAMEGATANSLCAQAWQPRLLKTAKCLKNLVGKLPGMKQATRKYKKAGYLGKMNELVKQLETGKNSAGKKMNSQEESYNKGNKPSFA